MSIPKQVEEAEKLALELHGQLNAPEEEKEDEAPPAEEPKEEPQEELPEAAQKQDEEDWKAKYEKLEQTHRTLRGKYDNEVPRLHHELKEFKEKVFSRLDESTKQTPAKPTAPDPDDAKLAKFEEEYGKEMLEAQRILARKEAEALLQSTLQERLGPVQEQVQNVEEAQLQAAKSNFTGFLDNQVKGDWRKLWEGQDPKFVEFLQQPDPSGYFTNGQLAEQFNANWDGDKLARLFNTYFESATPKVELKQPEPKPVQKPNPAQEARIAPSRQTNHNQPAPDDKRIWTRESMAEFQKAERAGKYSAEEAAALWADLLAAPSQNRMRG